MMSISKLPYRRWLETEGIERDPFFNSLPSLIDRGQLFAYLHSIENQKMADGEIVSYDPCILTEEGRSILVIGKNAKEKLEAAQREIPSLQSKLNKPYKTCGFFSGGAWRRKKRFHIETCKECNRRHNVANWRDPIKYMQTPSHWRAQRRIRELTDDMALWDKKVRRFESLLGELNKLSQYLQENYVVTCYMLSQDPRLGNIRFAINEAPEITISLSGVVESIHAVLVEEEFKKHLK